MTHILHNTIRAAVRNWKRNIRDRLYRRRRPPLPVDFKWRPGLRCPQKLVEAGGAVIGKRAYIFNGFESIDKVANHCHVFDLGTKKWVDQFATPADMPQTHMGMATDGERFIFSIGGQWGAQCSPCTNRCDVYDAVGRAWGRLPDLPEPRYLSIAQFWNGRIHVVGGSKPDRCTPVREHWSLAVKAGCAVEPAWREEVAIPRGGIHRGAVIVNNSLYVLGGTEGDVKPIPSDAQFRCDWNKPPELFHGEVYRLDAGGHEWVRLADMPLAIAHNDASTIAIEDSILIFGGTTSRVKCTDTVLRYQISADTWDVVGYLPYHMKSSFVACSAGEIFLLTGQRSISPEDHRAGKILDSVWMGKYPAP